MNPVVKDCLNCPGSKVQFLSAPNRQVRQDLVLENHGYGHVEKYFSKTF